MRRGTFTDVGCVLVANDGQCRAISKMRIEGTLRSIFIYDLVVACYIRSLKKEEPRFTFQIMILDLVFVDVLEIPLNIIFICWHQRLHGKQENKLSPK